MPNYSDTRVNDMIFNVLDSAKYNTLLTNDQLESNQLYFVTDDAGRIDFIKNYAIIGSYTGNNQLTIDLTNAVTADLATAADALNFVHTNELILGNEATQAAIHINHRRIKGGASSGNTPITDYYFKNGNGQTTGVTIHAASFDGNANTATTWKTARNFAVSDATAAHTGTAVSVNGSVAVTLPLPATITATLIGNASTASALLMGSSITSASDLNSFLEASKIKATFISSAVTYSNGTLSGNDGYVLSMSYTNTSYGNQIFFDPDSDKISIRHKSTTWSPWVDLIHTGNISDFVSASAEAWATARNFAISDDSAANTGDAVAVDGSANVTLPLPKVIYLTGNHAGFINGGETDKFFDFAYSSNPTASTAPGASWRIGALNSGSGDTNYFVIQTGGSATNATTWNNAIRIGMNTLDIQVGGNLYPAANNSKTLGTSSLKWANVYATTFTGDLDGNAKTATTWATARNFAVSDNSAAHTGPTESVNGSSAITLKLPATITATLIGNADTATNAAYQHYYYHDLFAFCRIGVPTLETTTNGTTWTAATLDKNIFDQKNLTTMTLFNNNITGYRWIWHTNNFSYSGGAFISTSWSYTSPASTQSITLETSSDGTTWTSRGTIAGNWASGNNTLPIANYGSDTWIRVTILRTSTSGTARLANLRLLSARPGDQGQGKEYEYPYAWDENSNVLPIINNTQNLGSSSLKWAHIYGDLVGNADSASIWKTARNFAVSDATAAHTGNAVSVDGSATTYTLPLPATITADVIGNVSSATKAYITIADTTKFYLIGSTNTTSGNADLKEDTGLYAGATKGQLGAAYVGINGDNTSYRLYVNGASLMTGTLKINTSTGDLEIGSTNASWTHFTASRDFYFSRSASFNGGVSPYTDLSYSLGSDSRRWLNVYANVLRLQGASSNPSTTGGARIEFTYDNGTNREQPVYIAYTPNDAYRAPAGLKVMGGTSATPAWFEVEGPTYSGGTIYAQVTTDSSSTSTGSIVASGGVGIAKQLRVGGATNLGSTLGVAGATTLASTLGVTGATTLSSTLKVTGATTLSSTLGVSGIATFSSTIKIESTADSTRSLDGTASIVTDGGVSVAKQLSAKMIKIDNGQAAEGCQLIYNETNNCLEFVFS